MIKIKVECYSGYKANERPLRFYIGNEALEVKKLLDRWFGEEADFFKLVADDGNKYLLKYDRQGDSWEMTMYSEPAAAAHSEGEGI